MQFYTNVSYLQGKAQNNRLYFHDQTVMTLLL